MISWLLKLLGLRRIKMFTYVPIELYAATHGHDRSALARARAKWGQAGMMVTLPDGGCRIVGQDHVL